jgi:hypothetical protein
MFAVPQTLSFSLPTALSHERWSFSPPVTLPTGESLFLCASYWSSSDRDIRLRIGVSRPTILALMIKGDALPHKDWMGGGVVALDSWDRDCRSPPLPTFIGSNAPMPFVATCSFHIPQKPPPRLDVQVVCVRSGVPQTPAYPREWAFRCQGIGTDLYFLGHDSTERIAAHRLIVGGASDVLTRSYLDPRGFQVADKTDGAAVRLPYSSRAISLWLQALYHGGVLDLGEPAGSHTAPASDHKKTNGVALAPATSGDAKAALDSSSGDAKAAPADGSAGPPGTVRVSDPAGAPDLATLLDVLKLAHETECAAVFGWADWAASKLITTFSDLVCALREWDLVEHTTFLKVEEGVFQGRHPEAVRLGILGLVRTISELTPTTRGGPLTAEFDKSCPAPGSAVSRLPRPDKKGADGPPAAPQALTASAAIAPACVPPPLDKGASPEPPAAHKSSAKVADEAALRALGLLALPSDDLASPSLALDAPQRAEQSHDAPTGPGGLPKKPSQPVGK